MSVGYSVAWVPCTIYMQASWNRSVCKCKVEVKSVKKINSKTATDENYE